MSDQTLPSEIGEQAAHAPSSTPSITSASQLPPEAIAFASRLFEAARKGDAQSEALIRAVLDRSGNLSNMTNDKGDSLIMLASYHGHTNLVKLLLQHGADPNRLNDRGQSPLAGTVFKNERDCILALLEGGADPEIGQPSALDSCRVFKQEEYLELFTEQVEKLKTEGRRAVNGNGAHGADIPHVDTNGHAHVNGNGVNGNANSSA